MAVIQYEPHWKKAQKNLGPGEWSRKIIRED